jgi:prostaglandin-endoperoxide synthase 2
LRDLLTAMVGYDTFTEALTNPLLAPQVFTEETFTRAGMGPVRAAEPPTRGNGPFTPQGGAAHVRVKTTPRTGRNSPQRASGPARCVRSIPAATS